MIARRRALIAAAVFALVWLPRPAAQDVALPLKPNSIRFGVIGDTGTGDKYEYDVAKLLLSYHDKVQFPFVLMMGDNLYGSERPQDFARKFETPYKGLLDAKVEFFATLGNHDDPNQRFYKPFNMEGKRYHTFKKGNVRFFVLDSNYLDPEQIAWLEGELKASGSDWKIPYFHHPLYSSGMHGSQTDLRTVLEPLFVKYSVNVVFAGHEHLYERIKPQKGIYYFTQGGGAKLRDQDLANLGLTAAGFDTDRSFTMVEIAGKDLYFQTVSRQGKTVDKGTLVKQEDNAPPKPPSIAPAAPLTPAAGRGRRGGASPRQDRSAPRGW